MHLLACLQNTTITTAIHSQKLNTYNLFTKLVLGETSLDLKNSDFVSTTVEGPGAGCFLLLLGLTHLLLFCVIKQVHSADFISMNLFYTHAMQIIETEIS